LNAPTLPIEPQYLNPPKKKAAGIRCPQPANDHGLTGFRLPIVVNFVCALFYTNGQWVGFFRKSPRKSRKNKKAHRSFEDHPWFNWG
jgi:hypothetical protein